MGRAYDELIEKETAVLVIGGGEQEDAVRLARMYQHPFPVLADPDRSVYRSYDLDKVVWIIQRSATVLVDKQGIFRYVHRVANPEDSLDIDALMKAVNDLAINEGNSGD